MNFDFCAYCGGSGLDMVAAHGCGGDETLCAVTCPVQEQQVCVYCGGAGTIEVHIDV